MKSRQAFLLFAAMACALGGTGCSSSRWAVNPTTPSGDYGAFVTFSTSAQTTGLLDRRSEAVEREAEIAALEQDYKQYTDLWKMSFADKDFDTMEEAMARRIETRLQLRKLGWEEKGSVALEEGEPLPDDYGFWRGWLWDFRDHSETLKTVGNWLLGIGLGTYAAGVWDLDDLTGGGGDSTAEAQATALQASSESDKNVVRGNNNTVKDAPQDRPWTVQGDNNLIDYQQDTTASREL